MSIVRAPRKTRNFTIIDNSLADDSGLSMRGLGLLLYILTRPDNWKCNSMSLAQHFGCGRDAVRSALNELAEAGYARLIKVRDPATGTIASEWHVFEEKAPPGPEVSAPAPGPENPAPENPVPGSSGPITRTEKQEPHTPDGELEPWPPRPKGASLQEWLDHVKAIGEHALPAEDPLFDWADTVGIPQDMLRLAWIEFKATYLPRDKHYQLDWRAHFRGAVRKNWYRLWFFRDGACCLTTRGEQLRRSAEAEQ